MWMLAVCDDVGIEPVRVADHQRDAGAARKAANQQEHRHRRGDEAEHDEQPDGRGRAEDCRQYIEDGRARKGREVVDPGDWEAIGRVEVVDADWAGGGVEYWY